MLNDVPSKPYVPFGDLLGPWPERVDPGAVAVEVREAYVCIPHGTGAPLPAVFCHHQHAATFDLGNSEVVGWAGDPNQAYAHELAERGFVTIAPDAIGFEERNFSADGRTDAIRFASSTRLTG